MAKVILLNRIVSDGLGDFSHFVDIYCYLRAHPKMQEFEFIPIICCDNSPSTSSTRKQFAKIREKMQSLDVPVYFLG